MIIADGRDLQARLRELAIVAVQTHRAGNAELAERQAIALRRVDERARALASLVRPGQQVAETRAQRRALKRFRQAVRDLNLVFGANGNGESA